MKSWTEFAALRPDLAEPGRALLYRVGVGLAYLATTRPDGAPRVHPMCPVMTERGAFAFIVPSPKQRDLRRDGRYALHSFPCPDNEDAFSLSGRVAIVEDEARRAELGTVFVEERAQLGVPPPAAEDLLVEFHLDSCLLTRTTGHGDPAPQHQVWRDR
ncbi:MAG TPA: pyridoxamine 5'-phosphate oxidase family protein [Acidimicrobiales bacterium]